MIWFTIALFVVSFLVTALLAPKPDIEDARAGQLDAVQFPRATEDAPIPLVLGKVRMNAPNTLWYGGWRTEKITQKVKTGLFSSKHVVVAHKYFLTLDLGLCLGPNVSLREIWIDEEQVWTGALSDTAVSTGTISENELFGGYKAGGGWSGGFRYYPGSFPQAVNGVVEGLVGAGGVPGYGGMAHIVFEDNYIGENNQLRKMGFVLDKYTNDIGAPGSGLIGDDVNPMEALYQICIDEWVGLGIDPGQVDLVNWVAAATTLLAEGNGVSVLVTSSKQGKDIIKEILRQIDAIMFQDPETGLLKIKLIRDDYDTGTIPAYDEDDILKVRNFTKTAWEDVVAQVKVSFPQRDKESSAVAISQDMATAGMVGRMKTVNMSFPFCYDPSLANKIASRERAQQSVPLFQMKLEMNRNAYTLRPGDVFKIDWPEYGLTDLVMRVQKHDLGELLNNKIVVDAIQDSFAVGTVVFADPVGSGWVAPVTTPVSIADWTALDVPFFFGRKLEFPIQETFSQPMALPTRPSTGSSSFSMEGSLTSGDLDFAEPSFVDYPSTGVLAAEYDRSEGQVTGIDATGFTINSRNGDFVSGTGAEILEGVAGILYVDGEWMGFTGVTNNPSTAVITNVYRGLFGSSVKTHAASTRVYQVIFEHFGSGYAGAEVIGDNTGRTDYYYKLLDAVGSNQKDPAGESEQTFTPRDEMRLPARPRGITLDGVRTVREVVEADGDLDITWKATDRETGTSYPSETAASETPAEAGELYDVYVYIGGVNDPTLGVLNTASLTHTIPFSGLTPPVEELDCEIRIFAQHALNPDNPTDIFDYLSSGYASLSFTCNIRADQVLLEGDMQSGTDKLLLEGDEQSGGDQLSLEGDMA